MPFRIRGRYKPVPIVISIGRNTSRRIRHSHKSIAAVIAIDRHPAVKIRHRLRQSALRITAAAHRTVFSGLGGKTARRIIAIGDRYALPISDGTKMSSFLVAAALPRSVRIFNPNSASKTVVVIDGQIAHGILRQRPAFLPLRLIGQRDDGAFRIRLFYNSSVFVIDILHHPDTVAVVPGRHPMAPVILIAQAVPRRIRHGSHIPLFIIGIAHHSPVRQGHGQNPILGVQGDPIGLPRRRHRRRQPLIHIVGISSPAAPNVFYGREQPIGIEAVCSQCVLILDPIAALIFCKNIAAPGGGDVAFRPSCKGDNVPRSPKPQQAPVLKLSQPFVQRRAPAVAQTSLKACSFGVIASGKEKVSPYVGVCSVCLLHVEVARIEVDGLVAEHAVFRPAQQQTVRHGPIISRQFPRSVGSSVLGIADKDQTALLGQPVLHAHIGQNRVRLHAVVAGNAGNQIQRALSMNQKSIAGHGGPLHHRACRTCPCSRRRHGTFRIGLYIVHLTRNQPGEHLTLPVGETPLVLQRRGKFIPIAVGVRIH